MQPDCNKLFEPLSPYPATFSPTAMTAHSHAAPHTPPPRPSLVMAGLAARLVLVGGLVGALWIVVLWAMQRSGG